jgi:membrane protease YdiL (CAAX protease family)
MITSSQFTHRSWQRAGWTQALAILLGIAPIYGMTIVTHLSQSQPYNLDDILFYTCVIAGLMLVVLLLLLRFLCGERFADLNLKPARWWQDVLGGIGLTVVTLGTLFLLGPVIERAVPRAPQSGLGEVLSGLVRDPWRLALFLGPGLAIGAAGFEEITRVFFLTRWWKIAPGAAWRGLGVLISAALFGLAHLYQGPGGMANAAISGLILAVVYLRFGRIWPLIISHYLHDALQIGLVVYLIRSGVMQL